MPALKNKQKRMTSVDSGNQLRSLVLYWLSPNPLPDFYPTHLSIFKIIVVAWYCVEAYNPSFCRGVVTSRSECATTTAKPKANTDRAVGNGGCQEPRPHHFSTARRLWFGALSGENSPRIKTGKFSPIVFSAETFFTWVGNFPFTKPVPSMCV